ncbi:PEP-CTERM sorting domain-containing protein [Aeoliella sp.]|uniref:PEP-CTERM sorting domain-containing protein n=1 Tax=Aeoliella sp. TaxID=2795800 RepID=UPI003CCBAE9F
MCNPNSLRLLGALTLAVGLASTASAQHADIMVQHQDGKLVTGLAELQGNTFTIPTRVFVGNLLSNYRALDPGFFSLDEDNPLLTVGALPSGTNLNFDFLPMTVEQTVSNLFYWDGLDDDMNGLDEQDVDFVRPDNEVYKVINNGTFTADASDQLIAGGLIETTAFDGSIHKHPAYRLETLDATTPDAGVYLLSMQLRMDGLETSDPIFLAMRTATLGSDALIAAQTWITDNIDMLTSPPMLAGDYNGDGLVNLADYTVWRNTLGSTTDLSANGDNTGASEGVIDAADYAVWKTNYGQSLAPAAMVAAGAVPEPATVALLLVGLAAASIQFRYRMAQ